jgi:hypothetical protein
MQLPAGRSSCYWSRHALRRAQQLQLQFDLELLLLQLLLLLKVCCARLQEGRLRR